MKTILNLSLLCLILYLEEITAASTGCPAVDPLDHSVYLQHETDCSKFYQCSNGVAILLHCSNGTLFNPDLSVCDWPENVVCQIQKCPQVDPLDTSIYFPHESDCTKFYQCSNGVPIEQSCGRGTVFNPDLNVCDYPQNVESCRGGSGGDENDENEESDEGSDDEESESNGESDENGSESEESSVCPAVDPLDHSVYLPHEYDCSKFYQCSNGVPILLNCSNGTLFNSELNVCDWPENVICQIKKCPKVDPTDTSIYFPHESDCSKFYQCSNGVPIEQSCAKGTVFNPNLNVCDYPQNVDSCPNDNGDE